MRVLVTAASRHGATEDIAERIAHVLVDAWPGAEKPTVDVVPVAELDIIDEYDALLLGSAVYMGKWMRSARQFAAANADDLSRRPVWLFSSGPVGDPLQPVDEPTGDQELVRLTGARGYASFAGRLRMAELGLGERATVRLAHVAEGDFRDWGEIDTWASSVAEELATATSPTARY
jgi:menaquinone-dependent protoporphyrinogen oxidase